MELKRILARDTRSATEKAMALYGPDVLIISNNRVEGQTELIVALDVAEASTEALMEDTFTAQESSVSEVQAVRQERTESQEAMSTTDVLLTRKADLPSAAKNPFSDHLHQALKPETVAQAKKMAEPTVKAEQILTQGRDQVRSQEIVSLVREELAALRQEFRLSQQTASWQMNQYWPAHIQPLVQGMIEAAVPTSLRALLQEGLREQPTLELAMDSLRSQLTLNLERPQEGFPHRGVQVVAGLSGSGKTLMAAKAAQQAALHYGPEYVAVVSYHDMRAGAWAQTQILCSQLGVDCFRASDAETLKVLLSELSPRKLIVIDTPGVQMTERLNEILQVCPTAGLHAVVPADASGVTLSRIMLKSQLNWQSLMISKLDEANSPWPLIQFLISEGAHCMVSAGGSSDKVMDGLKSSGLQKLINIALSQLVPPSDTTKDVMIEVNETNEPLAHTMGLSRPNWSVEIPQSEVHG
jgi:flagellar biosynthesis GTPase FlhF